MLSCRDVTERASLIVDGELPGNERFGVRVHLLICSHCRRFLRQLRVLTAAVRRRGGQHENAAVDATLQERIVAAMLLARPVIASFAATAPDAAQKTAPNTTDTKGNRDEPP